MPIFVAQAYLPFFEGIAGFIASLIVILAALKVFRPFARWAVRMLMKALAVELFPLLEEIRNTGADTNRKVTPNGGTEKDAAATLLVRLSEQVTELTAVVRRSEAEKIPE
jgi:hypothetical protein